IILFYHSFQCYCHHRTQHSFPTRRSSDLEQRERGLELLKIKQYYKQAGFSMTDKELPDYLPLMLEFCAQVPLQVSYNLLSYYKRSEEHTSELQSRFDLVCRLLLEKKKIQT